jgi:hypothetical protein
MSNASRIDLETRKKILMLLSDDEIASASTAETAARPLEGEDYLDLEDLDRGVRSALGTTPTMSHLLLRRSVHKDTWERILNHLAAHHTAKAHTGS